MPSTETHALTRDWRGARTHLNEVKAQAVADTLEHLNDLETMCERDGLDTVAAETRTLSSRLRSLMKDYEHEAAVGA